MISGSYDWLRLGQGATDRQCLLYDLQQRSHIRRSISTRGRAIANDWRISMTRAIVGNRATSGSDQRPMYDQLLRPMTDRTINRGDRIVTAGDRPIVASCDRAYDQSWHPACDRSYERSWHPMIECTSNRGTRRPIVRSIVGCNDRSHDQL